MKKLFIALMLVLCFAIPAFAADKYVDCDGLDAGRDYDTIQAAVDALDALGNGAHNIYAKGTCTEAVTIDVSGAGTGAGNHLTLTNWDGAIVMDGTGLGNVVGITISQGEDYITIKNTVSAFTIQDYGLEAIYHTSGGDRTPLALEIWIDGITITNVSVADTAYRGAITLFDVDYGKIENVTINSTNNHGVKLYACYGDATTHWIVDNIIVDNVTGAGYGIFARLGQYIDITNSNITPLMQGVDLRGICVQDCNNILIDGNSVIADSVQASSNAVGIHVQDCNTVTVSDNTVADWGEDCYEADLDGATTDTWDVVFERNVGYNCSANIFEMADAIGYNGSDYTHPVILRNNVCWITDRGSQCYGFHGGDGGATNANIRWYNNSAYVTRNATRAFYIGKSTGTKGFANLEIKNNIGYTANQYTIQIQGDNVYNAIDADDISNNSWYRVDAGTVFRIVIAAGSYNYSQSQVSDGTLVAAHANFDDSAEPAGATNVTGEPAFISPPTDLRLASTDARVDAGATIAGFSDDKNAVVRPQNGVWDIGAYEYIVGDITDPVVTDFIIPATSESFTVTITTFTCTDAVGVTGYKVTESAVPPVAGDPGWTASAPANYTVGDYGEFTLYAWCKDAAGNVSDSLNDTVTVSQIPGSVTGVGVKYNLGGATVRHQ